MVESIFLSKFKILQCKRITISFNFRTCNEGVYFHISADPPWSTLIYFFFILVFHFLKGLLYRRYTSYAFGWYFLLYIELDSFLCSFFGNLVLIFDVQWFYLTYLWIILYFLPFLILELQNAHQRVRWLVALSCKNCVLPWLVRVNIPIQSKIWTFKVFMIQIFDLKFLKSVMYPILLHEVILNFDKKKERIQPWVFNFPSTYN